MQIKLIVLNVKLLKGFTFRTDSLIKNFKRADVKGSPRLGFKFNSGSVKKNYNLADVNVNPLKGFDLRSNEFVRKYKFIDVSVNPQKGFTLIEMLVVLGVLTLAVGAIVIFLNSVLRGSQKANALNEVKQNSQIIVDSLERQIRGAQDALNMDISNGLTTVRLSSGTGEYTFIKCLNATNIKNTRVGIAIISESLIDHDEVPADTLYVSISNDEIFDGVEIDNCALTVYSAYGTEQGTLVPAVVSIQMDILKDAERVEYSARTSIQTTISLRRN